MDTKELAKIAVTITQVIKTNLKATPQQVVQNILEALPNTQVDDIIVLVCQIGASQGIEFLDVYDLIGKFQKLALEAVNDVQWNSLFQTIAQAGYYALLLVKGFLPPKWRTVVEVVLDAYDEIKK